MTLLAAATGSQDLASSIVSSLGRETSDTVRNPIYLAIGALIGSAICANMVITSSITITGSKLGPVVVRNLGKSGIDAEDDTGQGRVLP
ncbi:MAG: hypothetical protein P4M11_13320 [Candidatus Pacebacteria bacterium]|nr:hypothetical protein [Candidatus Paceibacterota bacterium]